MNLTRFWRVGAPLLIAATSAALCLAPAAASAAPTITVTDPTEDMSQQWTVTGLPSPTRAIKVRMRPDVTTPCNVLFSAEMRISTEVDDLQASYMADATSRTGSFTPARAGSYRFCVYASDTTYPGSDTTYDAARIGTVDILIRRPTGSLAGAFPSPTITAPADSNAKTFHPLTMSGSSEAKRHIYVSYARDDRACGVHIDADSGQKYSTYQAPAVSGAFSSPFEWYVLPTEVGHWTICAWLAEDTDDAAPIATTRLTLDVIDPTNPTGAPMCTVPTVKGMTATQAISAIVKAGCAFPTVKVRATSAVKPGQALMLDRASGASIPNITPLTLYMRRARICTVPALRGATLAQARIRATASGCRIGKVKKGKAGGVGIGLIAKVTPKVGKQLAYGAKITVILRTK